MNLVSILTKTYTGLITLAGIVLLFAPEFVFPLVNGAALASEALAQLVGASLLAFAMANWTASGSLIGGIYGRALLSGNQVFAVVAVLVLLRNPPDQVGPAFWLFVVVLAYGAVLYSILMFRPSWLDRGQRTILEDQTRIDHGD